MFACYYIFFDTNNANNLPMMVGTLYGAVTNTPGLGAANEALSGIRRQCATDYLCLCLRLSTRCVRYHRSDHSDKVSLQCAIRERRRATEIHGGNGSKQEAIQDAPGGH